MNIKTLRIPTRVYLAAVKKKREENLSKLWSHMRQVRKVRQGTEVGKNN